MTYTESSPILGVGTATAQQIDAWFARRGPQYAPAYAPDGEYKPPPPLGAAIVAISKTLGVNHDLVAGQIVKETAAWQSRYARERNNPGGLGAINSNPDLAIRFASPAAGIRAHISHLCTYVRGEGAWTADDPRYSATPVAWRGSVTTLSELDGKWAWPGVGYGAGIARLANDLLTTEVSPMATTEPTSADLGVPVISVPAHASVTGRYDPMPADAEQVRAALASINWYVVHDTEGTYPTDVQYLTIGHDASARAVIAPDGTVVLMVPLSEIAWTAGSSVYNLGGINYEVSGFAAKGYTDAQYHSLAAIMVWDHDTLSNAPPLRYVGSGGTRPVRERGILGHEDIPNPTYGTPQQKCNSPQGGNSCHADPGRKFDWARLQREIDAWTTSPPVGNVRMFAETGFGIGGGFRSFWEQFGEDATSIRIFGYPLTDELTEDGRTVQYFERSVFEYWPENPPEYTVLLRRLGADALEAA